MAARRVQRQIFSLLTQHQPNPLTRALSQDVHTFQTSCLSKYGLHPRRIQTLADGSTPTEEPQEAHEICSAEPDSSTLKCVPSLITEEATVKHTVRSTLKVSARHDLAMIFTCRVCDTRSVKTLCRESYDKGVVVARCDGCNNLHLIADRLGWFGEPGSVEEFLAARGEEVKKGSIDTLNLTLEDLAGKKDLKI